MQTRFVTSAPALVVVVGVVLGMLCVAGCAVTDSGGTASSETVSSVSPDDPATADCPGVQVAAYYFPLWHPQPEDKPGEPVGEWKSIKAAVRRFDGHDQPHLPFWGFEDESDPKVMARKIAAAADHAVDVFIFDWYYHSTGTTFKGLYLESALNDGYLKAPNNHRVKFALMWANHGLGDSPGAVNREDFDAMTEHILHDYFTHPNYWTIDGKPYFSIYEVDTFIKGLGGLDATREALAAFDARAKAAGLKGIHFNAIESQIRSTPPNDVSILKKIGFESVTSYIWVHLVGFRDKPQTDYDFFVENYFRVYDKEKDGYGLPYYLNVTMGWDPTPRMKPDQKFEASGNYPDTPILFNNTPARFKLALEQARARACRLPEGHRVVTINAWNEWGEGSYLEPDTVHGMAYLEAVRDVFEGR